MGYKNQTRKEKSNWRQVLKESGFGSAFGTAGVIGFHLLSGILVGSFVGYWLDEWLGTGPWMKAIFFAIGVAAGFRNMYLDALLLLRKQDKKHGKSADDGKSGAEN